MKIKLLGEKSKKQLLRPFYPLREKSVEFVDNIDDCDFILYVFKTSDHKGEFLKVKNNINLNKTIFYLNDDDPSFAEKHASDGPIWFVSQPRSVLYEKRFITIPLVMSDHIDIINDSSFLHSCRQKEKKYDFMFAGQIRYGGREVFKKIKNKVKNYYFEETVQIWNLSDHDKKLEIKKFLEKISTSKFVFAPRGVGTSSFRLYESLMVGSIPIVTDMVDFPFKDEVDWDSICIRGSVKNLKSLIKKAEKMSSSEIIEMRINGINFWEKYCKTDILHDRLNEILKEV